MKDRIQDYEHDEGIEQKLQKIAVQTQANSQFALELENRLRQARRPRAHWWTAGFGKISPMLRWAFLMILLAVALSLSIRTLIPAPQPAAAETPTTPEEIAPTLAAPVEQPDVPIESEESFPWRGGALQLAAALPQGPAEASVFLLQPEEPATVEQARQLAERFGVEGPVYVTPGSSPDSVGYLITDGRQRLFVQSALTYDYYADYPGYSYMGGARDLSDEEAAAAIDQFLTSHGFDFDYEIENPYISPGMYYVLPRTADGRTVRYNYGIPERLEITLDKEGDVILFSSYRVDYETIGSYGIRSAEEAFQQVLAQSDEALNGVLESVRGAGNQADVGSWSRTYPDDQTITLYTQVTSYPALEPGDSPLITLAQHSAQGNVAGLEDVEPGVLVEATGQFKTENGIRIFYVESWTLSDQQETGVSGTLRQEGEEIILSADDGINEYTIVDAPGDLPLNTTPGESYLAVYGVRVEDRLEWSSIQYFPSGSGGGGGGGGGGTGFYQLNLSGTPVPFPTEARAGEYIVQEGDTLQMIAEAAGISADELLQLNGMSDPVLFVGQTLVLPTATEPPSVVGQRLEGQRGIMIIAMYRQADGSERLQYGFSLQPAVDSLSFAILEGSGIEALQAYHNLPIDVWGTVERVDSNGTPVLHVERFEIPFPELDFQILKGMQRLAEVNGQQVTLFTTEDGTTYVQILTFDMPDPTILDSGGAPVLLETLAIPGETFGGYPALRVFAGATYLDESTQLSITANQPYSIDETPASVEGTAPTLTIEKVELVYYVPDPRASSPDPSAPIYIQPVWRFYGHYSNGHRFEMLVQALKEEYLLPELAPYTPPG